jgi:hypothetical protein
MCGHVLHTKQLPDGTWEASQWFLYGFGATKEDALFALTVAINNDMEAEAE